MAQVSWKGRPTMSEMEHWEGRYCAGDTPWDTGKPSSELQRVVNEEPIQPCTAIELGCGTGTNAIWLAQQGFDVTAMDISGTAVDRGRGRKATAAVRVRFLIGDVLAPPEELGGPYRFFFDRGCYHVVRRTNVTAYLRTLEQITEPGIVGLVLAGNAREPMQPGPPVVTEEELRTELGQVFEIVRLREFRFDQTVGEPIRPLGWSCLVRR
jgi:SAM-dependent methyltransferase